MAKILVINGVWSLLISGMLSVAVLIYTQETRFVPSNYHLASLQDSMKGSAVIIAAE